MKKILCFLIVAMLVAFGNAAANAQGQIVNFISAGGPDVYDPDLPGTEPGVDKNFSLSAFKFADGSGRGILIDRFASGLLPGTTAVRADLDCVHVVGNTAWVSGVITQGLYIDEIGEIDFTGWYVRTVVQDNGPNNDPATPDRVGISVIRQSPAFDCSLMRGGLFDFPAGQVQVR